MPRLPVLHAVLSLALSVAFLIGSVGPSQAKEYEVDGIVDCGRSSGEGCSIERVLFLRTEHVTGRTERIRIDVSWIQDTLPQIDQDDRLLLLVEDVPGGGLRALSVSDVHEVDGTINPGLSSGNKQVAEQPKPKQEDDHDNIVRTGVVTVGPPGSNPPPDFSISGSCENTAGGATCNVQVTGLLQGQVGSVPQIRISTKTSSAAAPVDEFRSCSPISPSLTTTCTFTTSGLVYEGGPVQITYLLAGGGTASTPTVFIGCVANRAPGEVC
jgi:hypothetical protein